MEFLTEDRLVGFLYSLYPGHIFEHDKIVPGSSIKNRPDYRNDDLKLIIEFDGYRHYSSSKVILIDEYKDSVYSRMGYNIIRMPYFVQLSSIVVKNLFNKDVTVMQKYSHGFIDDKAMLPCDYCELGIFKFKEDLKKFKYIEKEIISSLKNKIIQHDDINLVLPPSLHYIVH